MTRKLSAGVAALCFAVGCSSVQQTSTGPSGSSSALAGTWRSVGSGSVQDSCTNFSWSVTQFTGSTGSGTFSATCFGNVQIAGSASGTLNTNNISWAANATATVPNMPPCEIKLTGTATLQTDRIVIPYSGTTCLGEVSGTETVKR